MRSIVLLASLFASATCLAESNFYLANSANTDLPADLALHNKVYLWGFGGPYAGGEGQALLPIYSDKGWVFYGSIFSNLTRRNGWSSGAGFGFRQVFDDHIYGAYLLANYENAHIHNNFYLTNFGLERFGHTWDVIANAYIPIDRKTRENAPFYSSDTIQFTGHDEYDISVRQFQKEDTGFGADFIVGRTIPYLNKAKIYLGGYHFGVGDDGEKVNGVEAKLVYEVSPYVAIELRDNYNSKHHHQILFGFRWSLDGGYSAEEKQTLGISTRLLDPIQHVRPQFFSHGYDATTITNLHKHDNIWFFKESGDDPLENGTFEHPFVGFGPNKNNPVMNGYHGSIDYFPLMYFSPGQYDFGGVARYTLKPGWGIYGRYIDYIDPIYYEGESEMVVFGDYHHPVGGIDITGFGIDGPKTTIDSIHIYGNGNAALNIKNAAVILSGVGINNYNYIVPTPSFEVDGIYADNSLIDFVDGSVTAWAPILFNTVDISAYGLVLNHSTVNFRSDNVISVYAAVEDNSPTGHSRSSSIRAYNDSEINFLDGNTTLGATADYGVGGIDFNISSYVTGIDLDSGSKVNFNGGTTYINDYSDGAYAGGTPPVNDDIISGIAANGFSKVYFNEGELSISNYVYGPFDYNYGIYANSSQVYFNDGKTDITVYSTNYPSEDLLVPDSDLVGIKLDGATINFQGGENSLTVSGGISTNVFGIDAVNSSIVNFVGAGNLHNNIVLNDVSSFMKSVGIGAYTSSTLQINGAAPSGTPPTGGIATLLNDNYIAITRGITGGAADSYKIIGNGQTIAW